MHVLVLFVNEVLIDSSDPVSMIKNVFSKWES